jgi:hypothetical protein
VNIAQEMIAGETGIEGSGGRAVKAHADAVEQGSQHETRNQHDPKTREAMQEIGAPTPDASLEHAKDGTGDEVPAENEEDDNGLVTRTDK